jgi:hypothetical protein
MKARLALVVLVPMLVLALAACGGKKDHGMPTANGGTATATPKASASLSDEQKREQALKFARCMRDHGIDVPDPGSDKGVQIGGGHAGVADEKTKAAMEACRQYLPDGGDLKKPSTDQIEQQRKYAQCMRQHGVPNFPDPSADGGLDIGRTGLKPDDPKFKQADEACRSVRPGPVGGGGAGG